MAIPPYAKLRVHVNGGPPLTGEVVCTGGEVITFTAENTLGWDTARWELYDFPPGYPTPAGWTYDAVADVHYAIGTLPPPGFTLSAAAVRWGKYMPQLVVNGATTDETSEAYVADLVDTSTAIVVPSPTLGLRGPAYRETRQFSAKRSWKRDLYDDVKKLAVAAAPLTVTGTGFVHATGGTIDGATKLVQDADVHASAAIAYSKITAPGSTGMLLYNNANVPAATSAWTYSSGILLGDSTAGIAFLSGGATTGHIRIKSGALREVINTDDSSGGNRALLWVNTAIAEMSLGHAAYYTTINGNRLYLKVLGTTVLTSDGSSIQASVPRLGNATAYASEGRAQQAMADANQTAAASVYSRKIIQCTGTLTANRTLTLPHPTSEDASYTKQIQLSATGGFSIIVSTGTGTTASLSSGMGNIVEVACTPSGVALA